jgi:hypothetical protein
VDNVVYATIVIRWLATRENLHLTSCETACVLIAAQTTILKSQQHYLIVVKRKTTTPKLYWQNDRPMDYLPFAACFCAKVDVLGKCTLHSETRMYTSRHRKLGGSRMRECAGWQGLRQWEDLKFGAIFISPNSSLVMDVWYLSLQSEDKG